MKILSKSQLAAECIEHFVTEFKTKKGHHFLVVSTFDTLTEALDEMEKFQLMSGLSRVRETVTILTYLVDESIEIEEALAVYLPA